MLEKKGLVKLTEECGELIQIAAKKMTRMNADKHWDGKGLISNRLQNEIGDVFAACVIVMENFDLNEDKILERAEKKLLLFKSWMTEKDGEVE